MPRINPDSIYQICLSKGGDFRNRHDSKPLRAFPPVAARAAPACRGARRKAIVQ